MPFVLTVDQIGSRRRRDLVGPALDRLGALATLLPFARTVGDEFQGALTDPLSVLDAIVDLMRSGQWHIGLGIGPIEEPLPAEVRAARGPAFLAAREAVERAKQDPAHLAVTAAAAAGAEDADADADADVEAVLRLVGALYSRRSPAGWEVIDLVAAGQTHADVADRLGISRQAVGQRLRAAQWPAEQGARPALVRLLARADRVAAA